VRKIKRDEGEVFREKAEQRLREREG